MSRSPADYLRHILDEIDFLLKQVDGLTKETFLRDETRKRAFVRSLEVIGEATKNLPVAVRERYDEIEWRAMAGMRDRLIHGYFGVDYEIVWDVLTSRLNDLRDQVQSLCSAISFT
jgi:uncharacterized protein with HEPN domain